MGSLPITLGVALGGRYRNGEFIPQVALSFQHFKNDLFVNIFPALQYSTLQKELQYGVFGLVIYTPKLSGKWSSFNQLMFEPLFNKNQHLLTYQQLRVGLDYQNKFQFGLGANLNQFGKEFLFASNFGIFIRKDLGN